MESNVFYCSKCNNHKDSTNFYKLSANTIKKVGAWCKSCLRDYSRSKNGVNLKEIERRKENKNLVGEKICSICYEKKEVALFHKYKDERRPACIDCEKKKYPNYINKIRANYGITKVIQEEKIKLYNGGKQRCSKCGIEKNIKCFNKSKSHFSNIRPDCKICRKETYNNEKSIELKKIRVRKYYTERSSEEKFKSSVRSAISRSFSRSINGKYKKSVSTEKILGCSMDFFRNYIEGQFVGSMSFENHGKWHLDHIYPMAFAKNEQDIINLNHYTNFQPLWAYENIAKGAKKITKQLLFL